MGVFVFIYKADGWEHGMPVKFKNILEIGS